MPRTCILRQAIDDWNLAEALPVGRSTAERAFSILRDEGLLVFVPGRGAFTATADVITRAKHSGRE